ncbi:Ankyrin repeat domain-containing protein 35 [Bienertia sinuspersici]
MEAGLKEAACGGDVEFLKKAVASKPKEYFLTQFKDPDSRELNGNIFHLAGCKRRMEFIKEAMNLLPVQVKAALLSQPNEQNHNPLHILFKWAWGISDKMVLLILDFYRTLPIYDKPWLALDHRNRTPLHWALDWNCYDDRCAMDMLLMDLEAYCTMVDLEGNSLLYLACKSNYSRIATTIVKSSYPYNISGPHGSNPLYLRHYPEEVVELLLEKNPELIDRVHEGGYNMLHKWAMTNSIPFYMNIIPRIIPAARGKFFGDFIHSTTLARRLNPLHLAAMTYSSSDAVQSLIDGYVAYQKEVNRGVIPTTPSVHPWTSKDWEGNMPVHLALEEMHRNEESVIYLLSVDSSLWLAPNSKGDTPLFTAAYKGYGQVIEAFARIKHRPEYRHIPLGKDGVTILHCLSNYFSVLNVWFTIKV